MRDTQMDAFQDLQATVKDKRARVLSVIQGSSGITMFQISQVLNWPINRVSGRITELCDRGLVEDSGRRAVNPQSGKKVIVWTAKSSASRS